MVISKYVRGLNPHALWFAWPLALLLSIANGAFAQKPAAASGKGDAHASEVLIDSSIKDDPTVDKMVAVYSPKVHELDIAVGKLKGELKKGGMGGGSLGNLVTDGMRGEASLKLGVPVDLALMNSGGLRRSAISEGELRARDIFELLPFE